MNADLTLAGAALIGLLASGHCLIMCGGINAALALATARTAHGRPRADLLLAYQFGRVLSYAAAGALFAGIGGAVLQWLDQERVRLALRALSGAAMAVVGVSLLWRGRGFDPALGRGVWQRLAPLARRLMPVRQVPQALALGAIWGWMPCGLAYSVLLVAWLRMDALQAGAIMAAFGLGTVPAVLASAFGTGAILRRLAHRGWRSAAASVLVLAGALTAAGPALVARAGSAVHGFVLDCVTR